MKNFTVHSLKTLSLFLIPTIIIYVFSNNLIYTILFYAICVSIWIFLHLFEIANLINWLRKPRSSKVPRGIGIWQDIFLTLRRQAKSREKRKNKINVILQRFYKIISAIPDGVILLNNEQRIEWMNTVAQDHFNLSMTENLDDNLVNLIRNTTFKNLINSQSSRPFKLKVPMDSGDGGNRVLLVRCTSIPDDRQLIVSQDITLLEKLNKSYSDFVINISEELKRPLNILEGVSDFIESNNNEINKDTFESFVHLVTKEQNRMELIINDLTILSSIEKGFDSEYVDIINISDICKKIVGDIKSLSLDKKYTIFDNVEDNILVNGIEEYIYYGLKEIAINALKYTDQGGKIDISLSLIGKDSNLKILYQVKDNGIGIAKEHIPFITDRFYRVNKDKVKFNNDYVGTGLGLTIAKKIVENLGGSLEIESKLGEGSIFNVYLIPYQEKSK